MKKMILNIRQRSLISVFKAELSESAMTIIIGSISFNYAGNEKCCLPLFSVTSFVSYCNLTAH